MVEEHVPGFATVCMDECAPRQMSGLEDEDPTTSSSHHSEAQLVASELAAQASAANDTSSAPSSDAEQLCADDSDIAQPESPKSSSSGIFQVQREPPPPLTVAAAALMTISDPGVVVRRLRQENERLQAEVTRLRRLVISGAAAAQQRASAEADDERAEGYAGTSQDGDMASDGGGSSGGGAGTSSSSRVRSLEAELRLAREALGALRADRKRLRAEKFELLEQTKELYGTLEERERELRDFIRSYEQRARESESSLQQLSTEREERERERWSLLRHARDEAERSLSLAAQLNAKELQLRRAHEQLREARRQLGCCLSDQETTRGDATPGSLIPGDRGSCSADSGVRGCSDRETNLSDSTTDGATPTITLDGARHVDMDTISLVSSIATTTTAPPQSSGGLYQLSTRDCSPSLSPLNAFSRSVEQLSSPLESEPPAAIATTSRRPKTGAQSRTGSRGGTWGSISRVFARSRHRSKAGSTASGMSGASALGSGGGGGSSIDGGSEHGDENGAASYRSWSPLTEEGYAEKLRLLREAAAVPMDRWRAPTVLAWLEIALGMPQYGPRCAENVKSGKVLLELSDAELECGLGIAHPMHRRKLRLAIEEHRHPGLVRYPCAAQLGHTWVSSEWLPDLGLAQYSDSFAANMVDARVLEHLSKRELEKYLGVTRKFHQASIVHGIHVLRLVRYDRQSLASRRRHCDTLDADPLVWTNQRFVRWARAIDLAEYADNLKDSGVHGGLVVLEPSFNGDTMANALGIPTNKNMIRRHLSAELETLVLPARSSLGHIAARPLSRSCAAGLAADAARGTGGLRGSLSRALGLSSSSGAAAAIAPPQGPALGPLPAGPLGGGVSGGSFAGSVLRTPGGGGTAVLRCSSEKRSPTSSSSGSSSVVSRTGSPPLSLCHHRGGAPGSDSPVYATPCNVRHSGGHAVDMYHHHHHHRSAAAATTGVENAEVVGPDGRRPRRQHRRVRSIGDIDMAVIPV